MDLVTTSVFSPGSAERIVQLDQILVEPRLGLIAVADSPTPGEDGRVAFRTALDTLRRHIERHEQVLRGFAAAPDPQRRSQVMLVLEEAFARAAQEMFALDQGSRRFLATLDAALLLKHEAFVGHVGDGRVYLIRRGIVHQLTADHSVSHDPDVFDLTDDDPTDESELPVREPNDDSDHSRRSFTRALGLLPGVRVETIGVELSSDDRLVVSTAHLVHNVAASSLHASLSSEALEDLGPALTRAAESRPLVCAAAQLGQGLPFDPEWATQRLALLAPMTLFAHCTDRELLQIASATRPRRFPSGHALFTEGAPGEELFLLVGGRVRLERRGQFLALVGPGSYFGEMALLDERIRSATATAVDPCEVLVVRRDGFFNLLRANPMLATKILWNLALRLSANLRSTSRRLAELAGPDPTPLDDRRAAEQLISFDEPPPRKR